MAAPLIYDYRNLPVYKRDEDFLFKAISYKQGKLDANRAKLQGLYDQYSMMEATKDVDKEYIAQRLNEVKNIADQYAAGDMSSDYLTQNLMGNLDKVVDEKVINAVASTKRYNNEMQEWAYAKANEPDKYRDRNKDYVMSNNPNLQNWLGSEEVGAIYNGGSGFVEYVDYNKRMLEEMPKAMETLGEKWMELEPGSGIYYDKVTKERVPRNKMERVMRLAIGEDGYRQMAIDGWSEAKNYSDEEVLQDYLAVNQHLLDEAIERSEATKITISKTADEVKKKELEETKGYLDRSIERLRKKVESAGEKDKVSMYQELHRDRYEDNILSAYSYGTRITDRDIDRNSLETIKQQFAERKFSAEMALKIQKATGTTGATGTAGSDGGVFPGGSVVVDEKMGYSKDKVNLQTAIRESGAEALNKLKASSGLTGVDDQDWVTILSSVDINSLAGKESQEVELADGRKVTLDFSKNPELVANMIKYQNHVNGTDPAVKAYRDNIKELRNSAYVTEGGSMDNEGFMVAASSIGHKVEVSEDGSKKLVGLEPEKLETEVLRITSKIHRRRRAERVGGTAWSLVEPLTESEKETLKLWRSAGFLLSSDMDADVLGEATITFMDEMVDEGYSLKDAKSLGEVGNYTLDAIDSRNKQIDEYSDVADNIAKNLAPAAFATPLGIPLLMTGYFTGTKPMITKVDDMMTTNHSAFSNDKIKVFNDKSELALKQSPSTYAPDVRSFLINKKDNPKAFSAMRTSLKLDGTFDGVIEAWPVLDEGGVSTGEVRVKYYDKVEGVRGQEAGTETMTAEQFDKTGLTLGDITYSEYSITVFGENAPDLELGSSSVSRDKLRRMQKEGGGGSEGIAVYHEDYWRDMDVLATESRLSGEKAEKYVRFKSDFTSGGVNFKLKNDKSTGTYVYTMEDRDGNILAQVDSEATDIQGSQVSSLITDRSVNIKNDLATTYLRQLLTEQEESKYKY